MGALTGGLSHAGGGPCSFSANTLVATEAGFIPIGEIIGGEIVLAYNEATGEVGYYPVEAVWAHADPVIVYLVIEGERIETTPEHPFYTSEGEWVAAGELRLGDLIRRADGRYGRVQAVEFVVRPAMMYNLTVAEAHTYFVGVGRWLVHNAKCPYSNPRNRPAYGKNQVEEVWEDAIQPDGKVYDPFTGEELQWDTTKPRTGQWDMGHKPGHEYNKLWNDYIDGVIDKETFLERYRDPDNYFPQSINSNRSHRYEQ
jgi:hypothetical protein